MFFLSKFKCVHLFCKSKDTETEVENYGASNSMKTLDEKVLLYQGAVIN